MHDVVRGKHGALDVRYNQEVSVPTLRLKRSCETACFSPEGEGESLCAGIEKFDLERLIGGAPALADEFIEPLLADHPVALSVVRKPNQRSGLCRSIPAARWTLHYISLYIMTSLVQHRHCSLSLRRRCAMPDARIFDQFSAFFDNLPMAVRAEVSMVMVALAGDDFIDMDEEFDYETAARGLFHAKMPLHCLGKLINAVAVLAIYFAGNRRKRLGTLIERYKHRYKQHNDASLIAARDHYTERLAATEHGQGEWMRLRAKGPTAAALNAAVTLDYDTSPSNPASRREDNLDHSSTLGHIA
jgi:hypothetical protein